MKLEEQKELESHKAGLLMFTELNKQSVEFSMRALRGALVLNGGAITALAALQKSSFAVFLIFAWGAFSAVLGSGCGYAANYFFAGSWCGYQNPQKQNKADKAEKYGKYFHRASVVFWVIAMICFLSALITLGTHSTEHS